VPGAHGLMRIPERREGFDAGDRGLGRNCWSGATARAHPLCVGSHDPALDVLGDLLAGRRPGSRLASASVGSLGGILAVAAGEAHLAGSHLLDPETGEYNLPDLKRHAPEAKLAVVTLAHRAQGLLVPKGNPKGLRSFEDLARPDVLFVNRQRGSGTRVLLDHELARRGLPAGRIRGYEREAHPRAVGVAVPQRAPPTRAWRARGGQGAGARLRPGGEGATTWWPVDCSRPARGAGAGPAGRPEFWRARAAGGYVDPETAEGAMIFLFLPRERAAGRRARAGRGPGRGAGRGPGRGPGARRASPAGSARRRAPARSAGKAVVLHLGHSVVEESPSSRATSIWSLALRASEATTPPFSAASGRGRVDRPGGPAWAAPCSAWAGSRAGERLKLAACRRQGGGRKSRGCCSSLWQGRPRLDGVPQLAARCRGSASCTVLDRVGEGALVPLLGL
jgi:hypothetical protein